MSQFELIGIIAGTFTTIAFLPQVYQTWKTKSAKDVSLHMFVIYITGIALWITYGFLKNAPAIYITNIAVFFFALLQIILKIKYDRKTK